MSRASDHLTAAAGLHLERNIPKVRSGTTQHDRTSQDILVRRTLQDVQAKWH